jgi:putative protease
MEQPMSTTPFSLPLIASDSAPVSDEAHGDWHGWTATDAPHPDAPQGEYSDPHQPDTAPALIPEGQPSRPVELLAPAGGPEAAYAAFHYGADAIYLGLKKFSARAEAENFTLDELAEVVGCAHTLQPRRRVFVTINTLIRQDELAELVETLAALDEMGVDALIIQDLGVYNLVRHYFPDLELHASTQLSVHNQAGAASLKRLGFQRVVLARELTFEEVHDITAISGIETEVFIHGALCYSYSGLCLFSSQTLGRSGNRGKCAYSCRDSFAVEGAPDTLRDGTPVKRDPAQGFPFSMKDLALPEYVPALRGAGVSCFKIEGRKKSPLYVAATTGYYRRLVDGTFTAEERAHHEADMQTVFSRPWTQLFLGSHRDKEVADRDTVGHRGTPIGKVEAVRHAGPRDDRLRFRTRLALARHDGIQIDLPTQGKPFGFGVGDLWLLDRVHRPGREVFEVDAGSLIEVALPPHHPTIPVGAPVYCSASEAVKRRYVFDRPKPGLYRVRHGIEVVLHVSGSELLVFGHIHPRSTHEEKLTISRRYDGPFPAARQELRVLEEAAREAFGKLGDTRLALEKFTIHNDGNWFVPKSRLNQIRRELAIDLEEALRHRLAERVEGVLATLATPTNKPRRSEHFLWSVKVDRIEHLEAFEPEDWADLDEVIIDIARDHPALLSTRLEELAATLGQERIRLALPPLTRKWEEHGIEHKVARLRQAGWRRWEAGNLSAWTYLGQDFRPNTELDLSTDWSVYTVNRAAVRQLLEWGVSRFTLSPEDGLENVRSLLAEFAEKAVLIVYQDTPMFLAESCAYANLIGGCPGKANCRFESMEMTSSHGERVTALDYHCRTIVLNQGPFCLSPRLPELAAAGARRLRADFIYRRYTPAEARQRWRLVRAGKVVPGGHAANFDRGML